MADRPKVHERTELVEKARREYAQFVLEWQSAHDLTFAEQMTIMGEELGRVAHYQVRTDRTLEAEQKEEGAVAAMVFAHQAGMVDYDEEDETPVETPSGKGVAIFPATTKCIGLMTDDQKEYCEVQGIEPMRCCERAGEYNGYGSDGPTIFTCANHCSCHD